MIRRLLPYIVIPLMALLAACEKPINPADAQPVAKNSSTTQSDGTPHALTVKVGVPTDCQRLNLMLFDTEGYRAFTKIVTQRRNEPGFGIVGLDVPQGDYTAVCVAHSSPVSATIKSPATVQFTLQDGVKLSQTYSACQPITVGEEPQTVTLAPVIVSAQVLLDIPEPPARTVNLRFEYQGGSATFSPNTLHGTTKGKQTETRPVSADGQYSVYTFPYVQDDGVLAMVITALDQYENTLRQCSIDSLPVRRGQVTRCTAFSPQTDVGFTVEAEWMEDSYQF